MPTGTSGPITHNTVCGEMASAGWRAFNWVFECATNPTMGMYVTVQALVPGFTGPNLQVAELFILGEEVVEKSTEHGNFPSIVIS